MFKQEASSQLKNRRRERDKWRKTGFPNPHSNYSCHISAPFVKRVYNIPICSLEKFLYRFFELNRFKINSLDRCTKIKKNVIFLFLSGFNEVNFATAFFVVVFF